MDNPVASSCPGNLVDYNSSDNDEPATPPPGPSAHGRKSEIDSSFTDDISDDESICRSPVKSPVKKLSKRNRKPEADSEHRQLPTDKDFQFKEPKFRKKKFIFHPFTRNDENVCVPDQSKDPVEVTIPEQLAASYGLYIWPSSPVLAWYIWLNQDKFVGKRVVELGAGTALPGLLAAKLGAKVILTDSLSLPHCIENCEEGVRLNNLESSVEVQPLSWGTFTSNTLRLRNCVDLVIGSDLFFDPDVFEPLVVTVSWLLKNNPSAEFVCTVQERAADWSIETLLVKWGLSCSYIQTKDFLKGSGINEGKMNEVSDDEFDAACAYVRSAAGKLENKDLLYLYARFKQAVEGVCNAPKPSFYQLKEKSKWQAWMDVGQLGVDEAKSQYIDRLDSVSPDWRGKETKDPASGWVSVSCPKPPPEERILDEDKTLWDRVKEGDLENLERILDEMEVGVRDENGLSLLHWAADRGHIGIAEIIINKNCSLINSQDAEGLTPLHYASSCGHLAVVRLLLQRGADPNIQDLEGDTPNNYDTDKTIQEVFNEFSVRK